MAILNAQTIVLNPVFDVQIFYCSTKTQKTLNHPTYLINVKFFVIMDIFLRIINASYKKNNKLHFVLSTQIALIALEITFVIGIQKKNNAEECLKK